MADEMTATESVVLTGSSPSGSARSTTGTWEVIARWGRRRALWEIGPDGCASAPLRARLGLDSGYLQPLAALARGGRVGQSSRRRATDAWGPHGSPPTGREHALLDGRSDELAGSLLEPLARGATTAGRCHGCGRAAADRPACRSRDRSGARDARSCLEQYTAELNRRSTASLTRQSARLLDRQEVRPPAGRLLRRLPARRADRLRRGQAPRDAPPEIKRMWIAPRRAASDSGAAC